MRYLILLLAIAALPAIAFDVVVNGETVGQTDKLVIDGGKVVINTEGQSEPEPAPDPEPVPEPEPEPAPGSGCRAPDVVCSAHIGDLAAASTQDVHYTVPRGKVVASRFVPPSSGPQTGTFSFQRAYGDYNVWISESPGGPVLDGGPFNFNTRKCADMPASTVEAINWTNKANGDWQKCSLAADKTYYLNVEFADPKQTAGTILRSIK